MTLKEVNKKSLIYSISIFVGLCILIYVFSPKQSNESVDINQSKNINTNYPQVSTEQSLLVKSDAVNSSSKSPVVIPKVTPISNKMEVFYKVVSVIDGDTIKINLNGTTETLRLIGLDTPETVDPRKPVQCFGREASNKAKELLSGRQVRLETDPSQGDRDKYDRLLAYIYRDDGLLYNKYMIEQGYAHEYTYNTPYKYQTEFKTAETEARVGERGLWAPDVCEQSTPITPVPIVKEESNQDYGSYTCSSNKYNCGDFSSHDEAQAVFEMCGGVDDDIHQLDTDKDGLACESI